MEYTIDKNVILTTKRLILRFLEPTDKEAIFKYISHDKDVLSCFSMNYAETIDELDIDKIINMGLTSNRYVWAITLKDTNEVIGLALQCSAPSTMFNSSEVGYAIGKPFWNQGYMTEALKAIIDFLFSQGIHKVTATHFVENPASGRVMQKCDMIYQGVAIDEMFYHDKYHDLAIYYIINPKDR